MQPTEVQGPGDFMVHNEAVKIHEDQPASRPRGEAAAPPPCLQNDDLYQAESCSLERNCIFEDAASDMTGKTVIKHDLDTRMNEETVISRSF
jgi:hypothetical protein